MTKVYLAGAIDFCKPNTLEKYEKLKDNILKESEQYFDIDLDIYLPHKDCIYEGLEDIYYYNDEKLQESDVIIAYIGQPSTGTGFEIARAIELKKTIILYYSPNEQISSQLIGLVEKYSTDNVYNKNGAKVFFFLDDCSFPYLCCQVIKAFEVNK